MKKVNINEKEKWIAMWLNGLKVWDFVRMTNMGLPRSNAAIIHTYDPSFTKSITTARKEGHSVPTSRWTKHKIDLSKAQTWQEGCALAWKNK